MFIAQNTEQLLPVLLVFATFVAFTVVGCLLATSGLNVLNRARGRATDAYWLGGAGGLVGFVLLAVALIAGAPTFWMICAGAPIALGLTTIATAYCHNRGAQYA